MTDDELIQFLGKDIEVTYKDGFKFAGHACDFEWGDDEFESSLGVRNFDLPHFIADVHPSEVASIKVIERPKK